VTRISLWSTLVGGLLVALAGCGTQASNRITLRAQGDPKLDIPNGSLQDRIEIDAGRSKALYEGDIMVGRVTLVSHKTHKQSFEYRWLWYDSDDFQSSIGGGGETWKQEWINAEDEIQVQGRATTPGCVAGRFELRYKE
jgi:hypothetical protein